MRPRKKDRHLPARMHFKHGAFYYVHKNTWERLSGDYPEALSMYAERMSPQAAGGMADLIDRVLAKIAPNLANNTVSQYRIAANKLKPILVEFRPDQVKPKHIAMIKEDMADTPNMANRCISFLRVVFQYALEWQEVESNPCIGIKRHTEKKRDVYVTDEQFAAIKSNSPVWLASILDLSYLTGQRIGDVLAIRTEDVTDEGIFFKQQKTGAKLLVQMTPDLLAAIEAARAGNNKLKKDEAHLLWNRYGKKRDYGSVKDAFDKARTEAGLKHITIHDLRAKSLTDTKLQGNNATELAGHTSERMTDRYIRVRVPVKATPPDMPKKKGKSV